MLHWRTIALQYCVGFCHPSAWISHRCTYVPSLLNLPPPPTPSRLSQSPVWVPRVTGQVPSGWLFYIRGCAARETCAGYCSCVRLCATPWTVARQAPPSMGFSKQEYRSGLLFPPPGDLPSAGMKPTSPAWQADYLPLTHQRSPKEINRRKTSISLVTCVPSVYTGNIQENRNAVSWIGRRVLYHQCWAKAVLFTIVSTCESGERDVRASRRDARSPVHCAVIHNSEGVQTARGSPLTHGRSKDAGIMKSGMSIPQEGKQP